MTERQGKVYLDRRGGYVVRALNNAGRTVYIGRTRTRAEADALLEWWHRETR